MTRAEWDAEWSACFKRLRAKGYDLLAAQRTAREITSAKYGPQPAGPPLWLRVALKLARRKLAGLTPAEEKTMKQRFTAAILFGLAGVIAAVQVNGLPATGEGWIGLVGTFVIAAWGKFSSSTTFFAPSREEWTPEQRAALNG